MQARKVYVREKHARTVMPPQTLEVVYHIINWASKEMVTLMSTFRHHIINRGGIILMHY